MSGNSIRDEIEEIQRGVQQINLNQLDNFDIRNNSDSVEIVASGPTGPSGPPKRSVSPVSSSDGSRSLGSVDSTRSSDSSGGDMSGMSDMSDMSGSEASSAPRKKKREQDTPEKRHEILLELQGYSRRGYSTSIKCDVNTPLPRLEQELIMIKRTIQHRTSIDMYTGMLQNGFKGIEWAASTDTFQANFDLRLEGLAAKTNEAEIKEELTSIAIDLEREFGSIPEAPWYVRLPYVYAKLIYLTNAANKGKAKYKPKTKTSKMKGPSTRAKGK